MGDYRQVVKLRGISANDGPSAADGFGGKKNGPAKAPMRLSAAVLCWVSPSRHSISWSMMNAQQSGPARGMFPHHRRSDLFPNT